MYKILNKAIKLIKIFHLKYLKTVNLNTNFKIVIFDICNYIIMKFKYYIFVKKIEVNCFNIYVIMEKKF